MSKCSDILLRSEKRVEIGEGHWGTKTEVRVVIMVVQDGVIYLRQCLELWKCQALLLVIPGGTQDEQSVVPDDLKPGNPLYHLALPGASLATWVENEMKGLHWIIAYSRNKNALGH